MNKMNIEDIERLRKALKNSTKKDLLDTKKEIVGKK